MMPEKQKDSGDILELIRQFLDHKQWYDISSLECKEIENV